MLRAIRESGRDVGFKAAGGIRDTAAAGDYLALADRIMGPAWADPRHFRFGASGLLDDLLARLGGAAGKPAGRSYRSEERRVGKGGDSTCRSRSSADNSKKKKQKIK